MHRMQPFQLLKGSSSFRCVCILVAAMAINISAAETNAQSTTANQSQATLAVTGADQQWPADAADLRLHMIGNAHIDAPRLWPLEETNAIVHSTFRSALDRLKEDPQVTMTTS